MCAFSTVVLCLALPELHRNYLSRFFLYPSNGATSGFPWPWQKFHNFMGKSAVLGLSTNKCNSRINKFSRNNFFEFSSLKKKQHFSLNFSAIINSPISEIRFVAGGHLIVMELWIINHSNEHTDTVVSYHFGNYLIIPLAHVSHFYGEVEHITCPVDG